MKRSINEKKAWMSIFVSAIVNGLCFIGIGVAFRIENIMLIVILLVFGYFVSAIKLCGGFYSLGWEYHKLSQDD